MLRIKPIKIAVNCLLIFLLLDFYSFAFALTSTSSSANNLNSNDLPWTIESDRIEIDVKLEVVTFSGNVYFNDNLRQIWADTASYYQSVKKIILQGNVAIADQRQVITCSSLQFENLTMQGLVLNGTIYFKNRDIEIPFSKVRPEYLMHSGNNRLIVKGKKISSFRDQELNITNGEFTLCDCKESPPSWFISARSGHIIRDQSIELHWPVMYAHLFVVDVPVFAFPYISFPLKEKKWGFLAPQVSSSGNTGFRFEQPLYIPVFDSFDMTPVYSWLSQRGNKIGSEFRWYPNDRLSQTTFIEFLWDQQYPVNNAPLERYLIRSTGTSHHAFDESQVFHSHLDLQIASDAAYTKEFSKNVAKRETQYQTSSLYGLYQFRQFNVVVAENYYQDLVFDGSGSSCLSCTDTEKLRLSRYFDDHYPLQLQHTPIVSLFITPIQMGPMVFTSETQYVSALSNRTYTVFHQGISHLSYLKTAFPAFTAGNISVTSGINIIGFRDEDSEFSDMVKKNGVSAYPFYKAEYHIDWFKKFLKDETLFQHTIGPHIEFQNIALMNSESYISPQAYFPSIVTGSSTTLRMNNRLEWKKQNKTNSFSVDPIFQYHVFSNYSSLVRFGFDSILDFQFFRYEPQIWFSDSHLHAVENDLIYKNFWQSLNISLKHNYITKKNFDYYPHRFDQYSSVFGYHFRDNLHLAQMKVSFLLDSLLHASYAVSSNITPFILMYQSFELQYTSSCRCWKASINVQKNYHDTWPDVFFTFDLTGFEAGFEE